MKSKLPNTDTEKSIQELYSENPNLVTIQKAAKALKVSKDTLRRWEAKGKISSIRTTSGYRLYDLKKLIKAAKAKPEIETPKPQYQSHPQIILPVTAQTPLETGITQDHSFYSFSNLNPDIVKLPSKQNEVLFEPVKKVYDFSKFSQAQGSKKISSLVLKQNLKFYTLALVVTLVLSGLLSTASIYLPGFNQTRPAKFIAGVFHKSPKDIKPSQEVALSKSRPEVLAASSIAKEGKFLQLNLDTNIVGNLAVEGEGVFTENLTAPNILYSLVAGNNISITGDAQNPTISTDLNLEDATTTTKGIASFSADFFTVTAGAVSIANGSITGEQIEDGTITNSDLANTSITINAGSGLSGGGTVALGGSISISATGGTSAVSSITGTANQIIASASVGDITLSLPQDIALTSSPTFAGMLLSGSTSGTVTLNANAVTTSYTLTLPADDGSPNYVLQTDGSGNTSWVAQSGGGAGDLQGAYNTGNTIVTTTGRDISFTLASGLATSTSFELTNAGTANAFVLNDSNAASNISVDIQSGGVSSLTITESGTVTTTGNISTSAGGTINSDGTLTASDGFTMTTGALGITSTSGSISSTGLTGLTYTLSSGTAAITAPALNLNTASTGNTAIGNGTGTFALTSNGGLNVSTGGALTGVASIDTIAVNATSLTFAGAGTISSTTTSALTIDSGTTGTVNLGTGNNAKTINLGTGTAGNTINIGTNNTVADAINIGSALDTTILAGTVRVSGLSASSAVYTDGSSNLTTTAPTSGTIGYWDRTGTTLSPATAGDNITTSGNISTSGSGTITSAATLTASNGFTMTTGALSLTSTSGAISSTGLTALTYTLSSGTAAITAPTLNLNTASTGNTSIGNTTGTFALASNGGLNVTTGGALTGVASIDTIGVTATSLTFAGAGTISTTTTSALTLDSGTTGTVNLGTGNNAKTINLGTGNAGNTINIGTNNTVADAINIGSALDTTILAGTVRVSGLSASSAVYTDGSSNLTTTAPTSGVIGYWDRTGTTLSPATAGDNVTTSGNISTSGSGTITSASTLTASSGFTMTTGALSLTSTSGAISSTGLTGLTYTLSSGTAAITAPTLNLNTSSTGNTSVGNATGTFALTSNGGLNVSTGGALTGVASIDTIAVNATSLTFAGAGTISSTTTSAITLDSGTTGTVNLGTGNNAKTINLGTGTAGNTINIGTNNTVADAINIGSALDTTIITGTTRIAGLTTNGPVYTSGANGTLNSEAQLAVSRGGLGTDFSSTAQGSIFYFSGTGTVAALAPSTSGYVLTTQGAGANPIWSDAGSLAVKWNNIANPDGNQTLAMANYASTWNWATATTQTGLTATGNALTTGTLFSLSSTSTDGGGSGNTFLLDLARSGTNANASHSAYGLRSQVTNTGTTSTNYAAYLSASGASTNYALYVAAGNVNIQGLTASSAVYTDANKNLTSTAPTSGTIGYWSRTGTTLSPSTSGDSITTSGDISTTGSGAITVAGTFDANGQFDLGDGGDAGTISATTLDIDATGALQINSSGGAISIGNDAVAQAINIGTGAAARTITTGNSTGATALNFTSGTGAQTFTSAVTTGTTTSGAFVFNASSLTSGTALYLNSTATSGKLLDINATNTSGTISSIGYGASATLTGGLTAQAINLSAANLTATNQDVTGTAITIPTVTNTITSGTRTLTGISIVTGNGAGINQNGAGGTLVFAGADITMPALTQSDGTLTAFGTRVTTPSTITTGGTAYGNFINATGVGAGTLSGLGISSITGGAGTEYALNIGSGWDAVLRVGSTTVINGSGVTLEAGGGTGQSTYTTGDILYASGANTLAKRAIGNTNEVLTVIGGVPTWSTITGASCTNCVITDPTADQTIAPTGQGTTGLSVRQTSTASPTDDIFQVTSSDGATKYFYVDKDGNVSTTSTAGQTLTLTPLTDTTALTLVGTNVTSQPLQYINANNASATSGILNMAYGAAQTLTGTVIGFRQDLSTNVTATNQSVTGTQITTPAATNTSGTQNYRGIQIGSGALHSNTGNTALNYYGADITIPAITQTAGTLSAYGVNVTTPSSVTTGGTAYGYNVAAAGVGAGTLYGLNISNITAGAGTEVGAQIGSGWDTNLLFNDTTTRVGLADGGTLTILDTAGNSLCTITDSGSTGDLSCTGTISGGGSVGYWSRTGTTLSTATAGDNVTVDGTLDANGAFTIGDGGDTGAISATTLDIDATGSLQINSSGGAISIGNDAVAQNINVGTGAAARTITIGNSTSTTALAFNSGTGSQTFTSQVQTGTTTTSAFVFDATALTSGTGSYLTSDSITTGKLLQVATTGNTLTSGTLTDIRTTSTALTGTAGTGSLMNLDWTPGSSTTATGDLFALNIGANGSTTGNLFNILDSGSSIFSVSETSVTTSLPANFTSPGDVSIAYDLSFTNPVASYIKSYSALTIQPGDPFGSSNLTLSPYNEGSVYIPSNVATGNGVDIDADLLSSGAAMQISSTSTAGTGSAGVSYLLGLTRSGANSNASHIAIGLASTVTNTGTTSLNYAGYFLASGATANYALVTAAGNVGFGDTSPSAQVEIGDGTDSLQISTVGDMLFIDANGAASITGPAGGALAIAGGTNQNITLTPGVATGLVNVLTGNLKVGNGTPGQTLDGEDAYVEGLVEIDGVIYNDGLTSGTPAGSVCYNSSNALIQCSGASSLTGSGTSGQIAFFNGANSVTSESSGFGWDTTNKYFSLASNTGTTYGAGAGTGLIDFASTSLTTGTLLNLELTEGTLNGGHYLKAWDATAGATVFSVGEDGITTIAGAAGSDVFTITAGDAVMSDGSLTITDADNAASFSLTNNSATTADVSTLSGTALTTGSLLTLTGPSAGTAGLTDSLLKLTSDIGNTGTSGGLALLNATIDTTGASQTAINLNITTTNSNSTNANTAYGVSSQLNDSTSLANTNIGISGTASSGGNAAKTLIGVSGVGTSVSTTADEVYGVRAITDVSGIITSGTRNVYGVYSLPVEYSASTGGTTNLYGVRSSLYADGAAGSTYNGYSLYVANGTFDTDGTTRQIGLALEPLTGADTNIGICFDCDGTFGTSSVATGIQWGTDANAVSFYRSGNLQMTLTGSLLPGTDDAYALGADASRWSDVFVGPSTVHIGTSTTDEGTISYNTSTNVLNFGTDSTTNGDIAFFTDDLYLDKSAGNIGIGDTSPASMFTVGSGDLFQVNSSGQIAAIAGYTQASGNFSFTGGGTFSVTAADASLINLSAINVSGTGEGLILPQNATACSASTAEGQICWDTAGEDLYIGNGTTAVQMNGGAGSSAWSGITDPTGDQTLAFGDGEQNIWTVSSDTETFWTMTADSMTTGDLFDISLDGLTTGSGFQMQSTSTALTGVAGIGSLMNLEWAPGSSTLATGDLFALNIGANGSTTGNIFNLLDSGSSIFSVSETAFTTSLPSNFTAAGDTSMAYDLNFTNPTASYIKSAAPLAIVSGETFNSSNLTLGTYNEGTIVMQTSNITGTAVDLTNSTLTTGTGMNLNYGAITTGTGLAVSTANNTHSTGTLVTIASSSTAQTSGGLLSVVQSGVTTGFTGDVMRVVGSGTTGSGGTVLSVTGANTTAGTVLEVVGNTVTTTNGRVMTVTANALTSGIGVNISSSSNITSGNLVNIAQTGTTTQQAAATVAMSTTATTNASARLLTLTANSMTAGTVQTISSTTTAWGAGTMFGISKTGATGNTAFTGDIANITYSHTFNSTGTLSHTGNVLDMSRTLSLTGAATQTVSGAQLLVADSLTVNNASGTFTYSGDTVSISRAVTRTSGAITNSGNLMTLTSSDASHTGNTLSIADSATHASGGNSLLITASATSGDVMTITASSLTTGSALTLTGPTATGVTDHFMKVTSDIGADTILANFSPDFNHATGTGYGVAINATDATTNTTDNHALFSSLSITGNAARANQNAMRALISSTSTTADTLNGLQLTSQVTGAISSGARVVNGIRSNMAITANNTGGTTSLYGIYSDPTYTSSSNTTGSVVAVVGGLFSTTSTLTTGGTSNQYGVYIGNGTSSTTGTSTKYGLFVESQTGADFNYSIYSSGGTNYLAGTTGTLMVGTTTNDNASNMVIQSTPATTGSGLTVWDPYTTDGLGRASVQFRRGSSNVGQISMTSTNTSYTDLSDIRLKENITQASRGLNELMQIQVADYNFIANPGHTQTGFLAQQLYNFFPDAVTKPINPEDRWYVDYGRITPLLVKSIQDLNNKVENALLTINSEGQASSLNVSKISVSGDVTVGGIVKASDYSLNASEINRVGVLASLPVDGQNRASVADTLNMLAEAANEQESRIADLQAKEASAAAAIADAQILGEQALEQTSSLQDSVASTSATIANLSTQIEELFASITGTSSSESSDSAEIAEALTPPTVMFASDSATLDTLAVNSQATISGQLTAYEGIFQDSLKSLGETFLGRTNIAGDLSVDGTFSVSEGNTVNALPILYFQTSALAEAVDFFNGMVTITKDGAIAAKEIITEQISVKADSSAGTVVLAAGETEMPVLNELVESDSIIILTSETTGAPSLAVADKVENAGFVVKLGSPYTQDIKFSYLIVGQK